MNLAQLSFLRLRDVAFKLAGFCLAFAGCAGHPPAPQHSVSELVAERTGHVTQFDGDRSPAVDRAVADMLSRPIDENSAVRVALLNNRALAVQLQEVGIAEADYITASQIKNPAIYVDFRPPDRRPPSATDIEASATEDVLDILLLPLRKKIAQQQMDRAAILSADAALKLARDVRVAFITFVAHQQSLALEQQMTEAAVAAEDFARRQHDAGNINELDWATHQATCAQTQLELIHLQLTVAEDRETLNGLLGLTGVQTHWTAADSLDSIPAREPSDSDELASANARRLDIAAANQEVAMAEQALVYTRNGLLTEVRVGASLERETDKQIVIGPSLALELPIFNQHQGQITLAQAEAMQAEKKRDAINVEMESEVRLAAVQIKQARAAVALIQQILLPQRKAVTAAAQQQYNGMLIGLYALLDAKQSELAAQRESIESLRDYWIARADLDRAAGR